MDNNLNNEYIGNAINELIDFLGVKESIDYEILASMVRDGKIKESALIISKQLGLPIDINLVYVPDNYKAQGGESQFHSTQITKVDHSGKGIDGITAQVIIPGHLPFYGSSSLINFPITIKVSKSCMKHPVAFATIMAHELSHILLYSLQYRQKENEVYTDLTAMVLGFTKIFQNGRKTSVSREEYGFNSRTVHTTTTTYGYLTDGQFSFACDKINSILSRHSSDKNKLLKFVRGYNRLLKKYNNKYTAFKDYFGYISKNYNKNITKEDGQKIALFFQPGYFEDFDSFLKKSEDKNSQISKFVFSLSHFTKNNLQNLTSYNDETKKVTSELISKIALIKQNLKTLKKYIPYIVRLKNFKIRFSFSSFKSTLKSHAKQLNKLLNPVKVYILFFVIIIILFSLFHYLWQDSTSQPANNFSPVVSQTVQQPIADIAIAPEPKRDPVSLKNGTVLSQNSFFLKGLGKLDIDNGTDSDAVAKLVNTLNNKSVFTVYIKANSKYTISNVRDNVYELVFSMGSDWDKTTKKFLVNSGYEKFDDSFDFTTNRYSDGEYEHTQYTHFNVTLNPVVNGSAKTSEVNPAEFDNY